MSIKLNVLTAAILTAVSGAALAQQLPTEVPARYVAGPLSPFVDTTNLTAAEKAGYSIYEGILQVAEGVIDASSCEPFTASISVKANGAVSTPVTENGKKVVYPLSNSNYAVVTSQGGSFRLDAALWKAVPGRGQKIEVSQVDPGQLDGTNVASYNSTLMYNSANNLLVANNASWEIEGFNGDLDAYKGVVIKDFYRGATSSSEGSEYYTIYDWGLQAISKLNYPVEKYWQRSKSRRSDGAIGRTVFVKDRLVGESSCRITIDTAGQNSASNIFWQDGYLKVEQIAPGADVAQFLLPASGFNGNAGTPQP